MIKLNAKVASALDTFKAQGLTNEEIISGVLNSKDSEDGILTLATFEEIMEGLVSGYQAKPSPEKAVYDYYDKAKHAAWEADESDDELELEVNSAKKEAVEFVLNEFGIKIKGVND